MNKLLCVEYFLSITMGSVSYLKAHTKLVLHSPISLPVCQPQEGKCDTNSVFGTSHADNQLCGDPVYNIQLAADQSPAIWSFM